MKNILLAICGLLLVSSVQGQKINTRKLDLYFKTLDEHQKFMGSVAVSRNGKVIYKKTIGWADVEKGILADEHSKYRIGSISKTFTAVLTLKAIEEGKLTVDQTIDRFFPELENAGKITVKQLLTHHSGIHNFTDDEGYLTWHTKQMSEEEMLKLITEAGSDFEPGSKAEYSNSNFVLLTYLLEKVNEMSYADLLKLHITEPLALKNTFLGGKINSEAHECKSYEFTGNWKEEPETDISIPMGAGGVVATVVDLVKFSDALFSGKLLKKESLEFMKTMEDGYGAGLFHLPFYDKTGYGHTGGIDGFTSVFSYFSDGKISYALVSNGTNYNNNMLSMAVLSAVYNKPFDIPVFTRYDVTVDEMDSYQGEYVSEQIQLKITITRNKKTLYAQAEGQSSFPLEAAEKDTFRFDRAGVILEFNPLDKTMVLKQGGATFLFIKKHPSGE